MTADLTLKMAVDIARQQEQVKAQMAEQRHEGSVDAVNVHGQSGSTGGHQGSRGGIGSRQGGARGHHGGHHRGGGADGQHSSSSQPCTRCGRDKHQGTACPAMGKTCRA